MSEDKLILTHVKLETFKDSGKWYDVIEYDSIIPAYDTPKIIDEALTKAQKGMSFTFEASTIGTGAMNKRLVIINEKI